jgi:hypothetical protein
MRATDERDVPNVGDGWSIAQQIDIERSSDSLPQLLEARARDG